MSYSTICGYQKSKSQESNPILQKGRHIILQYGKKKGSDTTLTTQEQGIIKNKINVIDLP